MEKFMEIAFNMAKKAYDKQEVPIGAVVVKNGKVISKAFNKREKSNVATYHAEVLAINKACKKLHSWRLDDCDLYVTLKPCPMCAGAIVNARINTVYYGAEANNDNNLCENILSDGVRLNHKTNLVYLQTKECASLLTNFFSSKRNK